MTAQNNLQQEQIKQFGGQMMSIYTGSIFSNLIEIGHRTDLFEAVAQGPGTSLEISERARLNERYVREWLGAMSVADVMEYKAETAVYTLPPEHALLLTGQSSRNLAPVSRFLNSMSRQVTGLVDSFRNGGGIPYEAYQPELACDIDQACRFIFDDLLISGFIGAVEGLTKRLQEGIRVLDIGCGTGHVSNLLAQAFPKSTFYGYDISKDGIQAAQAEATAMSLTNVHFEVRDVTKLPSAMQFDLITAFDAIHDQKDPDVVLKQINQVLTPDGTYMMVEFKFSSNLEDNIGNPFAPMYYGISVMHCLTVSLAVDGAGLGTIWGEQSARKMLAEAGFTQVEVLEAPRPQNAIYVCHKE